MSNSTLQFTIDYVKAHLFRKMMKSKPYSHRIKIFNKALDIYMSNPDHYDSLILKNEYDDSLENNIKLYSDKISLEKSLTD